MSELHSRKWNEMWSRPVRRKRTRVGIDEGLKREMETVWGRCQIHGPALNLPGRVTPVTVYAGCIPETTVDHEDKVVLCDWCRENLRFFMRNGYLSWEMIPYPNSVEEVQACDIQS